MDRQLIVQQQGELYHLDFHNFAGSFEGHAIGKWLELEEVEHPGEAGFSALAPGQFYLENVMGRHPDLHAVVAAGHLERVVLAADHFHVRVIEGEELLPKVAKTKLEKHQDVNFLEYIDKQHESVIHKGPKAIVLTVLAWAIPAALVAFGVVVAARHMTDTREELGISELFLRAARPPAPQSAFQAFVNPDHSHELITSVVAIRYMDGERILLRDGTLLRFAGMRDVRPMLEAARVGNTAPKIHVTLRDGGVFVREVLVGAQSFGRGTWLTQEAKLAGSAERATPAREMTDLSNIPKDLVGERCKMSGVLTRADGRIEFDPAGPGPKTQLRPARTGGDLEQFLAVFADGSTQLDVVFALEREGRQDPVPAKLCALTVQNYHMNLEG